MPSPVARTNLPDVACRLSAGKVAAARTDVDNRMPRVSQRCHWSVTVIVPCLVHVPGERDSVAPNCALPVTDGSEVLLGAKEEAHRANEVGERDCGRRRAVVGSLRDTDVLAEVGRGQLVCPAGPAVGAQPFAPLSSQRCHTSVSVTGAPSAPVYVPGEASTSDRLLASQSRRRRPGGRLRPGDDGNRERDADDADPHQMFQQIVPIPQSAPRSIMHPDTAGYQGRFVSVVGCIAHRRRGVLSPTETLTLNQIFRLRTPWPTPSAAPRWRRSRACTSADARRRTRSHPVLPAFTSCDMLSSVGSPGGSSEST